MCVRQYFREDQYNDKNDNKDKDTDKYLKQPTWYFSEILTIRSFQIWFTPVTFATLITLQGPRHPAGHPPHLYVKVAEDS